MPPSHTPTGPTRPQRPADAGGSLSWLRDRLRDSLDRGRTAWPALWRGAGHGQCRICEAWSADVFCAACRARHAAPRWRCARCAIGLPMPATVPLARQREAALAAGPCAPEVLCADCRRDPPAFDAAWAALDYGPPWDRLVAAFKFHGAAELAGPLAALMLDRPLRLATPTPAPADAPTWLLPVPLTAERWRERGYNQAWELARRLGPALGLAVRDDLLERLVGGPHQVALRGEARRRQVRGAYAVPAAARAAVAGAHLVLVDDVMTTGATLAECARVLRRAGARRVTAWALARTPAE